MASPRVIVPASTSADLALQRPLYSAVADLAGDQAPGTIGSLNMDELLRHFCADSPGLAAAAAPDAEMSLCRGASDAEEEVADDAAEGREARKGLPGDRVVDGGSESVYGEDGIGEVTLEAFLEKAGVVADVDVETAPGTRQQEGRPVLGFVIDPGLADRIAQQQQQLRVESHVMSTDGIEDGKKRVLQEPLDKASQQKQRRMIKNRESAARSRERKQAYTADLEKLVTKLEDEKASLINEQEKETKARLKWLKQNVIPVVEKRRPPRRLRRTCSFQF